MVLDLARYSKPMMALAIVASAPTTAVKIEGDSPRIREEGFSAAEANLISIGVGLLAAKVK